MLRRNIRLRREFLYKKSIEHKVKAIKENKEKIKHCIEDDTAIDTNLKKQALNLEKSIEWDNPNLNNVDIDNEYKLAGIEDPKIVISTSIEPSSKLKQFVKELKLIFPNSQRVNRGHCDIKALLDACRENKVTDLIMVHEHRGQPDNLVICHLPFGPTAYFTLNGVVMRHDIAEISPMSEAYPHLIFHNFTSKLGQRTTDILKYLFPVPKEDSKRIITFYNRDDYISFRHHNYVNDKGHIQLSEAGPRFDMKLYEIKLGTLDTAKISDSEWVLKPYMNTSKKRKFLSDEQNITQPL